MRVAGGNWVWAAALIPVLAMASAQNAVPLLQPLIGAVLRNGPEGQLPPHLSLVLGLSKSGEPVPIKQALLREGPLVRTFNVSTVDHEDVVLMTYDEQSHSTHAYLTSASGVMRMAVEYETGAQAVVRAKRDAAPDFRAELKRWTSLGKKPAAN
jgi:hypothetical protein